MEHQDKAESAPGGKKAKQQKLTTGSTVTMDDDSEWVIVEERSPKGAQAMAFTVTKLNDTEICFLKRYKASNNSAKERFEREVIALTKIKDKGNFPRLLAFNKNQQTLIMSFLDGKMLSEIAKFTLTEAFNFFRELVEAVSVLHSEEIIHRDIKPDNIMVITTEIGEEKDPQDLEEVEQQKLRYKKKLYLVDLGLCYYPETKAITGDTQIGPRKFLTLPEYEDNEQNRKRDFRSDVALCCGVFRWMLKVNYRDAGDSHLAGVHHSLFTDREILSRLTDVNWPVFQILEKGLSHEVEDRYQMLELKEKIDRIEIVEVPPGRLNPVVAKHNQLLGWLTAGLVSLKQGNFSKMSEFGNQASVTFSYQTQRGITGTLHQDGHVLIFQIGTIQTAAQRPIILFGLEMNQLPHIISGFALSFLTTLK